MQTQRKRRRPMSEINVVPYIDVMLVLLVIFMITAPLLNLGVEVNLPKSNAAPLQVEPDQALIVTVLEDGRLYWNASGDDGGLVTQADLLQQVQAIVATNPDVHVMVAGDESVDYGLIYAAMVLLQQAGVQRVGLMSDPLETEG